jgi:hypothetical protein
MNIDVELMHYKIMDQPQHLHNHKLSAATANPDNDQTNENSVSDESKQILTTTTSHKITSSTNDTFTISMKNDSIYLKEIYIKFTKISSKIPQLWVLH